ncbi:hypothetical protein BCR42DRAFT_411490 [Absidia repens]|uniref:Uncharacterized protein n=1 Tax=Absidia repens TaxID=90262 RepID=A0A1X2ILT5_9FUNG|nr:hypothetical protein BCR42DRAFT_411490 [Absidia repens]
MIKYDTPRIITSRTVHQLYVLSYVSAHLLYSTTIFSTTHFYYNKRTEQISGPFHLLLHSSTLNKTQPHVLIALSLIYL